MRDKFLNGFRAAALTMGCTFILSGCGGGIQSSATTTEDEDTTNTEDITVTTADAAITPEAPTQLVSEQFRGSVEALGEQIFSDTRFSAHRNQSCASCHDPNNGFIDPSIDESSARQDVPTAVSLGSDMTAKGTRNTISNGYAKETPVFQFVESRERLNSRLPPYRGYLGGQLWDGRAENLQAQAGGPIVSDIEMQLNSNSDIANRVRENTEYIEQFSNLFGAAVLDDDDALVEALTNSLATFQQSSDFSSFDSLYDQFLAGTYSYPDDSKAEEGRRLFFSRATNCSSCHQLNANNATNEPFTSFEYHNIGVPANPELTNDELDIGLANNDMVAAEDIEESRGKFKTSSLRNVAVTAPYMHNGIFKELNTVIQFYMHRRAGLNQNSARPNNPETGVAWRDAEITDNVSLQELRDGRGLNNDEIEALECFMHSLTDQRFVSQLPDLDCF